MKWRRERTPADLRYEDNVRAEKPYRDVRKIEIELNPPADEERASQEIYGLAVAFASTFASAKRSAVMRGLPRLLQRPHFDDTMCHGAGSS